MSDIKTRSPEWAVKTLAEILNKNSYSITGKWPATYAFLTGNELEYWFWTYRVWLGKTHHVLEWRNNSWIRWFYTTGANPKWKGSTCRLE